MKGRTNREKLIELLKLDKHCDYDWRFDNIEDCTKRCTKRIVDKLIANGVTVQKWIPVSERLPNYREDVLVTDGKSVCTAWLSKSNAWVRSYTSAILAGFTHWMPLPQPPNTFWGCYMKGAKE